MPQFKLTKTFLVGEWSKSPWWKPFSFEWLNQAFWLAPLTAMLIISVAIIVFKMKKIVAIKRINQEQSLLIQFVCISLIWLFWHFMRKDTLNTSYFAYPLIIPFIYSLTSFLNSRLCKYTNNNIFAYILALTSFVLYSVPVFFKKNFHFKSLFAFEAILFLLFIVLFVKLRKSIFISASILSCVGVAPFYFIGYSKSSRDSYVAITEASKWIYETYGNRNIKKNRAKKVFLWFNEDSNLKSENSKFLTEMGYSLTNTSFDYLNQAFPMPSIDNLNRDEINQKFFNLKKHVIILVTESIDEVKKMQSKLLEFGYDLSYLEYHQIKVNNVSLPLYVLRD
jgi:hypothetical protein